MSNTFNTECECGNEEDFEIESIRFVVRKVEVDKDMLDNPVYKIRGQLRIQLQCPVCNFHHLVYINHLDANQFKPGEEPNFVFKKTKSPF